MKIAIESQRIFRSHKHGMDVVAIELIRQIQQIDKNNEYTLFARRGADNNSIGETPNFRIQKLSGLTYGDWEQFSLPRALQRLKPDLLHCTANTAPIRCPVPLVVTLHDIIFLQETSFEGTAYQNFGNLYRKWIVPPVIRKARTIITVSEQEKKVITTSCGVDPAKVVVIHNAVDDRFRKSYAVEEVEAFRKLHKLPAEFILHLGNTAPKKNTERMIAAYILFAEATSHPLPLVLADYPLKLVKQKLEELRRPEMIRNIHLTGYVPSSQMHLLYNCATLFVYPSLAESFGLPVLEAMACKTPVITSEIPALHEVAGDAAMFIDPASTLSIAEAMANLLTQPHQRNQLMEKGTARAALFSWRQSAEKLIEVYRQTTNMASP